MPYKILRTLEKGKYMHCIAPSPWECNNVVKWPKHNVTRLVKSANSLPQPDWRDIQCQVKRSNISTYEEAERELDFLLVNTDTDEETGASNTKQASQQEVNLNVLVEQLCANQEFSPICGEPHNQPVFTVPDNSSVITVTNEVDESSQIILTSSSNDILGAYCLMNEDRNDVINETQESSDINKTLNSISLILEKQDKMIATVLDGQNKMMLKMAGISIQIDNMQLQLNNRNEVELVSLGKSKSHVENTTFSLKPINSIEELTKMEKLLSEKTAREHLKETYSIVCSSGAAINCAYILIDVLFTRDFLCQCSWSGSSRSDGTKISLKCYKNTVSFFWEMVFARDRTFTIKDNEEFLKSILKNSNKRKNSKRERASTTRNRGKLETKDRKEEDNLEEHTTVAAAASDIENEPENIKRAKENDNIAKPIGFFSIENEEESIC